MKIQSLTESDLQAVRSLTARSQELTPDRDSIYWLFSEFFENTSIVIYSEDKLVGFLLGFLSQTKPNQGYIYTIGVAEGYRGNGIGKLLIESFQENIQSLGADEIYLTTTPDNQKALGFYEHMGFEQPQEFMKFGQKRLKLDRKSTRLNSSHNSESRMPSSA
jgi:ribosomal protein S18 acetylase RimI-like enzyme